MADASTGQVVDNTSAPKNSDSYYNKRGVEKDEATETLRDAEDAEEERQIQMRAKRGRMDMFCTTKVRLLYYSLFHSCIIVSTLTNYLFISYI